jgi:hypothetical protein
MVPSHKDYLVLRQKKKPLQLYDVSPPAEFFGSEELCSVQYVFVHVCGKDNDSWTEDRPGQDFED